MKNVRDNIRFIFRYIVSGEKKLIIIRVISVLFGAIQTFISLFVVKWIFDVFSVDAEQTVIKRICGIGLFLLVVLIYKIIIEAFIIPFCGMNIEEKITTELIEKTVKIPKNITDEREFYDKLTRAINDSRNRAGAVLNTVINIFSCVLQGIITALVSIRIDFDIAMVIMFASLATAIITLKLNKMNYEKYMEQTTANRKCDYSGRIIYLPQFSLDLRMYPNLMNLVVKNYHDGLNELRGIEKKYAKGIAMLSLISGMCSVVVISVMPWLMIIQKLSIGMISQGSVLVLLSAVGTLPGIFEGIFSSIIQLGQHSFYIDNIREIMNSYSKTELSVDQENDFFSIEIVGGAFHYTGQIEYILENIDFQLQAGEKIAIIGGNGVGKSTLAHIIAGVYPLSKGVAKLAGESYDLYGEEQIHKRIMIASQQYNVYSFSVAENILLRCPVCERDYETVKEVLKKVELYDKVMKTKKKMDTLVTKEFDNDGVVFSGGEMQKLVLGRIFAANPECIILDEATCHMDEKSEERILGRIYTEFVDKAIILITHSSSLLKFVNKTYIIENKKIKLKGEI